MKKLIILMLALVFMLACISVPVSARETENVGQIEVISNNQKEGEFLPRIIHRYEKTVVNFYDIYPVPTSINYQEYNMNSLFSGTLKLKTVEALGKRWKATYAGTLTGVI